MEKKTCSNRGFTFSVNTIPGTSLSEDTPPSQVLNGNAPDAISKKLLTTDNKLHSSTVAVLGNDDLLIEILLRLPALSLHLFKSVSKRWLSLITSPNFTLSRQKIPKIDPLAGLLILQIIGMDIFKIQYDFESFDIRIPSKRSTEFTLGSDAPPGLFVFWILAMRLPPSSPVGHVKIAFDPTKSPHYKVIHAKFVQDEDDDIGYRQIETYSSETGNWSLCGDKFVEGSFNEFDYAVYWNDALHWLTTGYECSHLKLKIVNDHPVSSVTELPRTIEGKLLESGGSLLLLSRDDTDSRKLNVFEMKNGCSEWSVKYIVNLNDIMMPLPNVWRINCHVWAIVSREKEEDSFMIIDSLSKVVQYNPMLKTLRTLYDLESTRSSDIFTYYIAYQFIPSFAGV